MSKGQEDDRRTGSISSWSMISPPSCSATRPFLENSGRTLLNASPAKEALEYLLKKDVAVILMDVSMPELDGFELAEIYSPASTLSENRHHLYLRGASDRSRSHEGISARSGGLHFRSRCSGAVAGQSQLYLPSLHRRAHQLQTLNGELRRLSVRLITMQDEERRRIARELHDGLGQELVAAKMLLHRAIQQNSEAVRKEAAIDAAEIIDRGIQQVRSMSHLLHPPLLDEVGLVSALRWFLEGFSQRSGIETAIDVEPVEFARLTSDLETAIFRIIQESLSNVLRHSKAHKAWVTLSVKDGLVVATVRDDGRGINNRVAQQQPGSIGIGISGMGQRAKEFGGELRLAEAHPGTLVEIVMPCKTLAPQDTCATA